MQNGLISDSQISASTEWDSNHGPSNSRLYYTPHSNRTGAWSSKINDINQWLQIDFKRPTAIVGISTQGRAGQHTQFVESYIMSYSQDGLSFQAYKPHGVLKVNYIVDVMDHMSFKNKFCFIFLVLFSMTLNYHAARHARYSS